MVSATPRNTSQNNTNITTHRRTNNGFSNTKKHFTKQYQHTGKPTMVSATPRNTLENDTNITTHRRTNNGRPQHQETLHTFEDLMIWHFPFLVLSEASASSHRKWILPVIIFSSGVFLGLILSALYVLVKKRKKPPSHEMVYRENLLDWMKCDLCHRSFINFSWLFF